MVDIRQAEPESSSVVPDSPWEKSYSYLRSALVGLLIALGVAIIYQTALDHWHPLESVSAYYYTPAQVMFVSALIGVAACMIALNGSRPVEEAFLNLGGMCAAVVAVVPTARSADFRAAVRACEEGAGSLLTDEPPDKAKCLNMQELVQATKDSVENNMVALLVVGVLCLFVSVFLARRDTRGLGRWFWWGYAAACTLFAVGTVTFLVFTEWFINNAHPIAAVGLLLCIVAVAIVNALNLKSGKQGPAQPKTQQSLSDVGDVMLRSPNRYAWLAWLMVGTAIVGGMVVLVTKVDIFWLEIAVAGLFLAFWAAQTYDYIPPRPGSDTVR